MTRAPKVRVCEVDLLERDVRLRMPFRFGIVTLTEAPEAYVRVRIETADGRSAWGVAAELLAPKWFDKNPDLGNEDNFDQLRLALGTAAEAYLASGAGTAFDLHATNYAALMSIGRIAGLNPLVAGYGPALIDRAVLDALGRALGATFGELLRDNLAGIGLERIGADIAGFDSGACLARLRQSDFIHARHCIGMLDPLTGADQAPRERIDDGLPETLEEVAATYRNRFYKIKLSADRSADLERVRAIAAVLDRRLDDYRVTLDGNELYTDTAHVAELWRPMREDPALARLCDSVLYFEQPIERSRALEVDLDTGLVDVAFLIDESDGRPDAFAIARERGYRGVSSKSCKGLYKSLLNRVRCAHWNASGNDGRFFMSGEDLTCQAGVSIQQDLAIASILGLDQVERNGHHFGFGMRAAPARERAAFANAHPGLYRTHHGVPCLAIDEGVVDIRSLDVAGLGVAVAPHFASMRQMRVPGV